MDDDAAGVSPLYRLNAEPTTEERRAFFFERKEQARRHTILFPQTADERYRALFAHAAGDPELQLIALNEYRNRFPDPARGSEWWRQELENIQKLWQLTVDNATDDPSPAGPLPRSKPKTRTKQKDYSELFDQAQPKLTDRQREALSLRFEFGLSETAISEELQIKRTTVHEHIERGSRKLRNASWSEKRNKDRAKSRHSDD